MWGYKDAAGRESCKDARFQPHIEQRNVGLKSGILSG
ncbi:hypothetical protein Barb4_01298 [Bacteroidales bacterium Barb4]|nr:hypothetical protein Barb4_01298 [Bacteroidales bacterium Barb4]